MGAWLSGLARIALQAAGHGDPDALIALFAIASLTEAGIPSPLVLDTVLFYLGYEITGDWVAAITVVLVLLLAREVGSAAVYWVFRLAGSRIRGWLGPRLARWQARAEDSGKKTGVRARLLAWVAARSVGLTLLSRSGMGSAYAVALGRLTPGLLTAVSVGSGIIGVRYRYFFLGIGMSSLFVDVAEISLGAVAGYGLLRFGMQPGSWLIVVGGVANVLLIWGLSRLVLWGRSRRKSGKVG